MWNLVGRTTYILNPVILFRRLFVDAFPVTADAGPTIFLGGRTSSTSYSFTLRREIEKNENAHFTISERTRG